MKPDLLLNQVGGYFISDERGKKKKSESFPERVAVISGQE
jgi:hypothetical protein